MFDKERSMEKMENKDVASGLHAIARSLDRVAEALNRLGTGNASTSGVGALEFVGMQLEVAAERIATAIHDGLDE